MILKASCDPAMKAAFVALAEKEGITESELLRQIVARVIEANLPSPADSPAPKKAAKKDRVHVRLTVAEHEAARALADAERRTVAQWLRSIVRRVVGSAKPFNPSELDALREVIASVGPIGRNLNTVVQYFHRSGRVDPEAVRVADLAAAYASLRNEVTALVDRASSRYETPA